METTTILAAHALIKTALHDAEKVTPSVLRAVVVTLNALDEQLKTDKPTLSLPKAKRHLRDITHKPTPLAVPPPRYPL